MSYRAVIEQRLRFMEVDQSTVASLERVKQSLDTEFDELLDKFYAHLLKQPELRALLSNRETMARAREAQKNYWLTHMFAKQFDQEQFAKAERIATAHLRIGLEPSWYMSGYCFMLNQFVALACRCHANDTKSASAAIQALNKLVFLDMNTVIDMYLEAKNATMREVLHRATVFTEEMTSLVNALQNAQQSLQTKAAAGATGAQVTKEVTHLSGHVANLVSRLKKFHSEDRLTSALHLDAKGFWAWVRRLKGENR